MAANYFASIREHAERCLDELERLSQQSQQPTGLTRADYYVAERVLQVLIEAAIGLAKHKVRALSRPISAEAYESFVTLSDAGVVGRDALGQWKKIIGLRNALVHDYLNIERRVIDRILQQRWYRFVYDFIAQCAA